jgi:hypothetical protein
MRYKAVPRRRDSSRKKLSNSRQAPLFVPIPAPSHSSSREGLAAFGSGTKYWSDTLHWRIAIYDVAPSPLVGMSSRHWRPHGSTEKRGEVVSPLPQQALVGSLGGALPLPWAFRGQVGHASTRLGIGLRRDVDTRDRVHRRYPDGPCHRVDHRTLEVGGDRS